VAIVQGHADRLPPFAAFAIKHGDGVGLTLHGGRFLERRQGDDEYPTRSRSFGELSVMLGPRLAGRCLIVARSTALLESDDGDLTVHLGRRLVEPGVGEPVRSGCCAGPVRARVSGPNPHSSRAGAPPCHGLRCGAGPATLGETVAARTDIPAAAEVAVSVGYQPCRAITLARGAMASHRCTSAPVSRTLDAAPNSHSDGPEHDEGSDAIPTMSTAGSFPRPRPGPANSGFLSRR
jgi:hypothetical protein